MRMAACALALALLASPVSGETQLYVECETKDACAPVTGDTQLRQEFKGPMPRTGEAEGAVVPLLSAGACALAASRVRDGPRRRKGRGSR